MSTFSHTDWTVTCDYRNGDDFCSAQERTDTLDLHDGSGAADVRKILKRRGWTVNVPAGEVRHDSAGRLIRQRRRDYCPKHNTAAVTHRDMQRPVIARPA